ncbi:hypothetical protein [Polaromonas sp. DSR2-3-2]|uniref:hypothetical protein n=1 Tax=unclassified Polaromonas TaxID=2638319 RepID=UPI003CE7C6DB
MSATPGNKTKIKKGVRPELPHEAVTTGFERLCSWTFRFAVEAEGPVFTSLQKLCQFGLVARQTLKFLS